jgi:nucleoporin NUP159
MSVSNAQEQRHKDKHAVRAAQQARQQAEEEQDLSDKEDEKVREELENEVEATKTLDDFLAHQDYIGTVTKPGIPGQIEKVYRDVNSMVDTLGLNARALEGFVKGHEILAKDGDRSIEDLADADWCLVEIDDLVALEDQVEDRLSKGRLEDVQGKLDACRDLRNGLAKLKKRRAEVRRTIEAIPGEEETNALKLAPLATDQSSKQNEMRKNYTKVQKLIADAEENLTMLRARLASLDPSEGRTPTTKKPTVEAVTRTINKMTSMVEKRSGDIDFLEAQMRKLRFTPVNQDSSREGSPSAAGSTTAKMPLVKTLQGPVSGLIESPSSNLRRSIGDGGTPRRRLSGITPQEVTRHRAKVQRRREVNEIMREAFAKATMTFVALPLIRKHRGGRVAPAARVDPWR